MAETYQVIVGGTTYNIDSGTYSFVLEHSGMGAPPAREITERGPFQHGESLVDFRYDPRIINMVFGFEADSRSDAVVHRDGLYSIWRAAARTPSKLKITREDASVRQIDFITTGPVDMPKMRGERIGTAQRFGVQLKCYDPFFYDPIARAESFQASGAGLAVPFVVPRTLTGTGINEVRSVTNNGQWRAFPVITITGPITDAVITNSTTGETLDFTDTTISDGDYYTIDLRYGFKTVRDSNGVSRVANLSDDSDLTEWHLDADPDAPGGINSITVSGSSGGANTRVSFQWNDRYLGA